MVPGQNPREVWMMFLLFSVLVLGPSVTAMAIFGFVVVMVAMAMLDSCCRAITG